jgi:hypothetical protein
MKQTEFEREIEELVEALARAKRGAQLAAECGWPKLAARLRADVIAITMAMARHDDGERIAAAQPRRWPCGDGNGRRVM